MNHYRDELEMLGRRLGTYPEDNQVLLADYKALATKACAERSQEAGEALLSIAYTIGERISAEEDLEPYYRNALVILEQFRQCSSYFTALDSLAWFLLNKNEVVEAASIFERIVNEKASSTEPPDYFSLSNLALAYERAGKMEKALSAREQAFRTWQDKEIQRGTPDVAFYAQARAELARLLSLLGKHREAEAHYRSVLEDNRNMYSAVSAFGRWHQSVVDSALDLVCCLFRQGRVAEAKEILVEEMPASLQGLNDTARMFASIARKCYERALKDLEAKREPSSASRPEAVISSGFLSENN